MTAPETITGRFALALAELTNPAETARSHHGAYVPLGDLLDHVRPVLAKHGLAVAQLVEPDGVRTILVGVCGDMVELGTHPVQFGGGSQQVGSAITYARRYGLAAALGVFGDADDDGQAATKPAHKAVQATKPATGSTGDRPISERQLKALQTKWSGVDREQRLAEWAKVIGRSVETAKDLTAGEARQLLDERQR